MSSTSYDPQHLRPSAQIGGFPQSSARLNNCLETIRQEFEAAVNENTRLKSQLQAVERKLENQVNQLKTVQEAMFDLEAHHSWARQVYESDLHKLRNDLHDASRASRYPPGLAPVKVAPGPQGIQGEQAPPRQAQSLYPSADPEPDSHNAPSLMQRRPSLPAHDLPVEQRVARLSQAASRQSCDNQGVSLSTACNNEWTTRTNPSTSHILDVNLMHTLVHESPVLCARFSADGQFLATGCYRFARIYEVKTGEMKHVIEAGDAELSERPYIRCVCFSPNGKLLATSAHHENIIIWDIASGKVHTVFEGHTRPIFSLEFSRDGSRMVSGSADGAVRIWNLEEKRCIALLKGNFGVMSVAMSPNSCLVAAGSLDTVVRVWDVQSNTLIECLRGHKQAVTSVAFTPNGKSLVSGSLDSSVKLWNIAPLYKDAPSLSKQDDKEGESQKACLLDYDGHRDQVCCTGVSHDGRWLVSGSSDGELRFWEVCNAVLQLTIPIPGAIRSLDLDTTSGILVAGGDDCRVRVWRFGPAKLGVSGGN